MEVPIIDFGIGSFFQGAYKNRDYEAVQLFHRAVDLGITWFDTAHIYGDDGSSEKYTWSLPVASSIIGMTTIEEVEENAMWASAFQPMLPNKMRELSNRLSSANKITVDNYFANQSDTC